MTIVRLAVIQVADTGSFMTAVPRGVIPVPRHWDPENLILTKWLHNKDWMPVSSTGMTAVLRHTVTVSLDPANKQRDDDCQASCHSSS
ncbi:MULTISPECIES: WPE palindromic element domain-containing protein [unclassified Wolbachia]|uniref:WPE palindromic element domain-containing protein n=1 Tax=unclassified Wolbachia TaxID=2640676 RepID=UPI00223231D1|nr:WPE palindromic element domain-containing protein [Wolbachia endosymbiont (group A) of Apoderus coryli]